MKEALEYDTKLEGITTGSIAVDHIVGNGGFPRRRVSEVFGWESSGKTTLCLSSCANNVRRGLTCAYIDMERAVDLQHAAKIGINFDGEKAAYLLPANFEETMLAVETFAENDIDLIVVDSVPALTPKAEMEGNIDGTVAIGLKSRLMSQFLSRITKTIATHNNALVLVNQMRAKINTAPASRWEPTEQSAGGSALKFYTSLRIDMTNVKKLKSPEEDAFSNDKIDVPYASLHRAEAFKNKVSTPYRRCSFYIKYGRGGVYGIDNTQTIIDFAKHKGVIQSSAGGYFKYTSPKAETNSFSLRGTEELYNWIVQRPELRKEIREAAGI